MFPIKLIEFLIENKVNTILWATSAMNLIANSKVLDVKIPMCLKKVFFAGEAMHGKVLNAWREKLPNASYINLYGPTEVTVDCSYYIVNRDFNDNELIPIGNNCRNMEIFLLNENLDLFFIFLLVCSKTYTNIIPKN
jgi:non-ribosomal peptide synthetase component F